VTVAAPFRAAGQHLAVALPGGAALFTTRRGGHSTGPFASLNLGRLTDDDPAAVAANRAAVESEIGARLVFVRQVHGARVVEAAPGAEQPLPEADAQVTSRPGVALAALTADCLPIAVAGGGAAAIIHAGWRGLDLGVIAAGVAALRERAGEGRIEAAIGPGAGRCCYEVGDEVRDAFAAYGPGVRDGRCIDLKAIARAQLLAAGVDEVHDADVCTICSDPELFFSHRRDRGVTGRQAGVVWLT
jgi:YfiH family protein